ncbi:N-formylglutamate amidohydrolase [Rubripirellula reticaptiva]|uniref:N-formylglutamate amidohydrolase n=1 Tax=Rubripirellula reticaptiva TaxID=2528013 RepID=A0A5C6EIY1_9BACT|nr:N-formylglutamate amidohydrolase [Rubripirellula reticaptiva]TWU49713.1 N-formylglutamate amidohydrolase [Rubripirellula reticaptiva]
MCLLISCEVGGDSVPAALIRTEGDAQADSKSSKHFETGPLPDRLLGDQSALYVAKRLATGFDAPLIANRYSPQLIDVGRSLHHRELFPKLTRQWSPDDRQSLIDLIYLPYRDRIRRAIAGGLLRHSYVIHLSIRTFDLRSRGKVRRTDVGLLYDPSNNNEVDLCLDWIDELFDEAEMLKVRRNYPRRGTTDSITKAMRSEFAGTQYLGIELMLNRAWAARDVSLRDQAIDGLIWSLKTITDGVNAEAA